MHIYIYIYTLFHHTELTSVLPHRWPSFTTLGKPTIWMVTYLSPSYIHAYVHTHILLVLQIAQHHTYIYMYSVSPHRVNICFTTQIAQFYHTGETNNLDGDLSITILYTHMYTHAHIYTGCFTDSPPSYTYIYIHIYALFHHTEWSICFTVQIAHHHVYIYIHIYSVSPHRVNICFTSQMAQFYHTGETNNLDGDLSITVLYTHMYTHTYCLFYR